MSETGDGLDHLRIPFEKIKFGKKLEVQGYGTVFEGEFDGQRVALKQLNITNLANVKPQLLAEILTISRFRQHPNLVALLGFCDEKSNEVILVYEYVASGNLADKMRKRLTTIQRFEICLGAARGLDYLHTGVDSNTPGIVHGNIKLSKILLNSAENSSKFEAKVSSFGLSKIVPGKAQKTPESSDEVSAKPTKELDVYSFGVLLLEVLCGVSELVDTDDYQERHVTELVPKKMQQNKLQKVVHFDIGREIKPDALETYAKIACQCVTEDPDLRPTMAQVVEELEKALRLQGGEVTHVEIPGFRNVVVGDTVVDDGSEDGGNVVIVESNIHGNGSEDVSISTSEEVVKDSIGADKLDIDGEDIGDEDDVEKNAVDDIIKESVPNETHNEESSNNDERESLNDEKESNIITVEIENDEENKSKIPIEETDPETIIDENKEDETSSKSMNGDTTKQEVQDSSGILKSDRGYFNEDELECLRIPMEKIKFGEKIDGGGYGSMFKGEYNDQQVALKRLNISGNIKPKLLSAILTIYRFRKHPNLVALIGFCDENNKEMIFVYEYVSGGNLADKMSQHLKTIQRLEICLGAARGLEYLHNGIESVGIIHGDLKLNKILLNSSKFEAKVSGFGLPKLVAAGGDVELLTDGGKECDVYDFGVLLLQVLCGDQERHVTEVVPKRLEEVGRIVDFDIREEITSESLETYTKIASKCVMNNPEERPTMHEVVEELEKALRLQCGKVSDHIMVVTEETTTAEDVPDDSRQEEENTVNEEESKMIGGEITTLSKSDEDSNSAMEEDNGNVPEETVAVDLKSNEEESKINNQVQPEDDTKEKGNDLMNEEIMIADGLLNTKKPEFTVTTRDFSAAQTQESERNTHLSEANNGDDDTTASDYLLPAAKKASSSKYYSAEEGTSYCGCCICSCWQFIYKRVVLYGGLFWNKLVSCFTTTKKD